MNNNNNNNSSNSSRNNHLGVNKISKNIRKHPLPQSNNDNTNNNNNNINTATRPVSVSQPQVYNTNKNDFRNLVQQLTGSHLHHSQEPVPVPVCRPPVNPSNSPNTRLQRIRPPPLSPLYVNRPRMPVNVVPLNNNISNSNNGYDQFGQPRAMVPAQHAAWSNAAESPISAYMRYLQHSINDPGNPQSNTVGLLPNPYGPPNGLPPFPSPRMSGPPPLLPSPSSQFLLPSPSSYLNLGSPRSPYPLLSPGYQFPPLSPNFPFSPGILGPGPQPPRSPGVGFPLSPGFFPGLSPRWRDQNFDG